ncbi:MAG: LssY C-terminal domain-containing protein [Bryobacteraceae bacterium]
MGILAYLPMLAMLLPWREIPAGTPLEIRLTSAVGTYASKAGSPVSAVLTTALIADHEVLLAAGSSVTGQVKSVRRVGFGIVHETAAIELEFNRVTLPDGTIIPISAHVIEVDNARERVGQSGLIFAERATASVSNRAIGYVRMAAGFNIHAQLGMWAVKTLVSDVPEAEIYFPTGTDFALDLDAPLSVTAREESADMPRTTDSLTSDELAALDEVIASMPQRTANHAHHASDVINVMFIGTREQVEAAFLAAGWFPTPPSTFRSHLRNIRAVMENQGNRTAPMSALLLAGQAPDMMWQKGLNDVGKRHHIRIWKRQETWNGQEIWVGAATHDIDYAFLRPGMPITHRISGMIDRERDKVVHDLEFASSVDLADWLDRTEVTREMHNATGDRMSTDGRLAVIQLRDLPAVPLTVSFEAPLPMHGKMMQRLARREILSLRNELLRDNSYWRSYEAIRWAVTAARHRNETETVAADVAPKGLGRVSGFVALR